MSKFPRCSITIPRSAGDIVSAAFITALLTGHWETTGLTDHLWSVVGLIAGGVVAAPVAGWATKVLPHRALTWLVGVLVTGLAAWQAWMLFV